MIEQKELQLDGLEGRRVMLQQLNAKDARHVVRRLLNTLGGAIKDAGAKADAVAELVVVGSLLEQLDDATIDYLTEVFEKKTLIERTPGAEDWAPVTQFRDVVFGSGAGLKRWAQWLRACIEFSCGDFFADLWVQARRAQAQIQAQSASPSTSSKSGASTASQPQAGTTTA